MATTASILSDLKKKGRERTRIIYARHGNDAGNMFGVSVADLKAIAKGIKGQQALACQLYDTGNFDAMYLAGLVADGAQMNRKQLGAWADGAAGLQMIGEYTVPWVALDNPAAREVALEWMKSNKEHVAASGWCTYSGIVATTADENLDTAEIQKLLATAAREIKGAKNRVRHAMNGFVIAVGTYVKPLLKQAKAAAKEIGAVSADNGDTACEVRLASEQIAKIEASGRIGKKRKTMRC